MKRILTLMFTTLFVLGSQNLDAQRNFLTPTFSKVKVTKDVKFGENYTIINLQSAGKTTKQSLLCDIYEPEGDGSTKRPLVILLHTGNFVPQPTLGGSPQGRTTDSVLVEIATRLAKLGYVVASADYRIGWLPTSTSETTRKFTLINAAYRGVHDVRNCVRYFRNQHSTYRLDTNKVCVWGSGTGGYLSLAAATLDNYTEIFANTTPSGKFLVSVPGNPNPVPMVIEGYNSNVNGTTFTRSDATYQAIANIPAGDTLNIPNYPNNTSNIQMAVNMGGALGDLSWLDANSAPIVSFHVPTDIFAPYDEGVLKVPVSATLIYDVVNVFGSFSVANRQNNLGTNAAWKAAGLTDAFTTAASSRNGGREGLFPMPRPAAEAVPVQVNSSPWDWWDAAFWNTQAHPSVAGQTIHTVAVAGNLPMTTAAGISGTIGRRFVDSMIGYFAPRAFRTLNLATLTSDTEVLNDEVTGLKAFPNPAGNYIMFASNVDHKMQSIEIMDLSGRIVHQINNVNNDNYYVANPGLRGMFIAKVKFESGISTRKIVFN
jgi:alpha/beta superfamily hydrolase